MNHSRYAEVPNTMLTGHRTPTGRPENRLKLWEGEADHRRGIEEE